MPGMIYSSTFSHTWAFERRPLMAANLLVYFAQRLLFVECYRASPRLFTAAVTPWGPEVRARYCFRDHVYLDSPADLTLRAPSCHVPHRLMEQKELSLEKLSTIERFTLWKGRIV